MYKTVKITPGKLTGKVCAPPSKSAAHRALLCASLSSGVSKISNLAYSQDILASINAAKCLGAEIVTSGSVSEARGVCQGKKLYNILIDCNESGSTLRFIIPIALAIGGNFSVTGSGRLLERPLDDYYKIYSIDFKEFSGSFTMTSYDHKSPYINLVYKDTEFKKKRNARRRERRRLQSSSKK